MMISEDTFVRFLLGDVAMIYMGAYLVQWVADKVWFCYVDKVLDAARTRRGRAPPASGGLWRNGFSAPA